MPEVPIQALKDAIRGLHRCDSAFAKAVPVVERFQGRTVWEGAVAVFDLIAHPKASRRHAWSHETEGGKRRSSAVLGLPPVASAVDAVRASVVQERRGGRGSA